MIIKSKRTIIVVLSLCAFIGAGLVTVLLLKQNSTSQNQTIKSVSRHIVLPSDEQPAVLSIVDKNKVTSAFLNKAENGDKVLVYQTAQRAIIYRPSIDRIVDVGPVVIDEIQDK